MNLYIKSAHSACILFIRDRSSEFMGKRKRKLAYGSTFFALWLFFDHLGYAIPYNANNYPVCLTLHFRDRRGRTLLRHINRRGGGEQRKTRANEKRLFFFSIRFLYSVYCSLEQPIANCAPLSFKFTSWYYSDLYGEIPRKKKNGKQRINYLLNLIAALRTIIDCLKWNERKWTKSP